MDVTLPLALLVAHTLGDFVAQSNWMAINKSKNWLALSVHVLVYSLFFLPWGLLFFLITFATHFVTDAITSRITSKLWFIDNLGYCSDYTVHNRRCKELYWMYGREIFHAQYNRNRHWFFVMIGIDQLIHFITLALTHHYLFQ